MKYKLFLLLFLIIPLVNALTFEQNQEANIRHAVRVNDGIPSTNANCNITISYPNGTLLVDVDSMSISSNSNYFNYTLNTTQTSIKGEYDYEITCVDGNLNATESFSYLVNYGGIEPTEARTDSITRSIYFIFGIGVLLFLGFLFINFKLPIKATFFLVSLLFFLIGINLIFLDLQDQVVNSRLEGFFSSFTAISFYIYLFVGFLIGSIWILSVMVTLISRKRVRRLEKFG